MREEADTRSRFAVIEYDSRMQFVFSARQWNYSISSYICQLPQQGTGHIITFYTQSLKSEPIITVEDV